MILGPLTLTKQADVHLLQGVDAAELVQLVVNLVEYQSFVIVCGEVPHNVVHCGKKKTLRERESRRDRSAAASRNDITSDMSVCTDDANRELRVNTLFHGFGLLRLPADGMR